MKGRGEDSMLAWLAQRVSVAQDGAVVRLHIDPKRSAETNKSPDIIIDVEIRLEIIPGYVSVVKIPLMIEVEAGAGFSGALEDLERFVTRSNDGSGRQACVIELPYLAATEANTGASKDIVRNLPVRFKAIEVSIPQARSRLRLS